MGQTPRKKIVIVIILMVLTGSVHGYLGGDFEHSIPAKPLKVILQDIPMWNAGPAVRIDPEIIATLEVDDYVNMTFSREKELVSLYVGYYHSAHKVGAAHDPLVCFPGQGWKIHKRMETNLVLNSPKPEKLKYATMVAEKGQERQLLIYWFQAHDVTLSSTSSQKLWLLWKKINGANTDNAFVRITVPITGNAVSASMDTAIDFARSFYPAFLRYINTEWQLDNTGDSNNS